MIKYLTIERANILPQQGFLSRNLNFETLFLLTSVYYWNYSYLYIFPETFAGVINKLKLSQDGVELLPLSPGGTVQSMIPLNYTLTKVEEVGNGSLMK